MAIVNTGQFKPLDWDDLSTYPVSANGVNTVSGSITNSGYITQTMPGNLIDYNFEHDMDYIRASDMPEHELEVMFKKELAHKLAEKMIADGHIVFTKQQHVESHTIRYKAYTWVGNKAFIEQQRKANQR